MRMEKSSAPSQGPEMREVRIDRAIYLVDDAARKYKFLKSNPDWKGMDPEESLRNQLELEGYTRIFRSGREKVFHYNDAPSRTRRLSS